MKHQNISAMAKANGVNPATAHNRLAKGWSAEAATSTPARKYSKSYKHGEKAAAVWAYVVANPLARPCEVAKATNISYGYVFKLMRKTSTPRKVFEAEAAAKADVTEDVNLEQSAKDDTSLSATSNILIGAAIVIVVGLLVSAL